jgi:hypothetical protein
LWLQKKGVTTNFSPLSFVAVFESGIQDPGSGMGNYQDTGFGINIPDPQHWSFECVLRDEGFFLVSDLP